jgi:DNA mismatch endonuclease (patch repair protein)
MVDKKRSQMMASVRTSGTKPELLVREALLAAGYRYRLGENYRTSGRKLPGKPDIVLPGRKAVIFVHGCFWHRHDCHFFVWPKTRVEFWEHKLNANHARDIEQQRELIEQGWRVGVVWECALRGREQVSQEQLILHLTRWIEGNTPRCVEISGGV